LTVWLEASAEEFLIQVVAFWIHGSGVGGHWRKGMQRRLEAVDSDVQMTGSRVIM
jgi:hypothetical protein